MYPVLIALAAAVVAFIAWRWTSVGRGARQRDEKLLPLLDPLAERLRAGVSVREEEVAELAKRPELRQMLYHLLKHFGRAELFPQEYLSPEAQGLAILSYWMMHPNELQDGPTEIEPVQKVPREVGGSLADFFVYRYRMGAGHWAEKDGWILGVAGPFTAGEEPFEGSASAFSRCGDKYGEVHTDDLVDWYVKLCTR